MTDYRHLLSQYLSYHSDRIQFNPSDHRRNKLWTSKSFNSSDHFLPIRMLWFPWERRMNNVRSNNRDEHSQNQLSNNSIGNFIRSIDWLSCSLSMTPANYVDYHMKAIKVRHPSFGTWYKRHPEKKGSMIWEKKDVYPRIIFFHFSFFSI